MIDFNEQLIALVVRAKLARNSFQHLKALDTLPAITLADDLSRIGGELIQLSVQIKQQARAEADSNAKIRPRWQSPKMNAKRAGDALRRAGAYSVTL